MGMPQGGVAFFDSGIGGLTVLSACRRLLPDTPFYYYGDNKHAPYGNLPPKKIKRLVFRAFRKLEKLKPTAAVLACNTATAVCVEALRKRYLFPIIGTEPAVCAAAKEGGEIFVLSTSATYRSPRFQALCKRAEEGYPAAKITAYPCEGLAGAIERRLGEDMDFTSFLPRGSPQAVVLGCTHYPYIREQIEDFYGCKTVDGNEGVARRLKALLEGVKFTKKHPKKSQNHRRPLTVDFRQKKSCLLTSNQPKIKKRLLRQNINKRSFFRKNKIAAGQENKGEGEIFFLGRSKKRNQIVYKQMFV